MKEKLITKIALIVLPRLLDLAIKMLEEVTKFDIDQDGKIGRDE
jgi:hypothetical protein